MIYLLEEGITEHNTIQDWVYWHSKEQKILLRNSLMCSLASAFFISLNGNTNTPTGSVSVTLFGIAFLWLAFYALIVVWRHKTLFRRRSRDEYFALSGFYKDCMILSLKHLHEIRRSKPREFQNLIKSLQSFKIDTASSLLAPETNEGRQSRIFGFFDEKMSFHPTLTTDILALHQRIIGYQGRKEREAAIADLDFILMRSIFLHHTFLLMAKKSRIRAPSLISRHMPQLNQKRLDWTAIYRRVSLGSDVEAILKAGFGNNGGAIQAALKLPEISVVAYRLEGDIDRNCLFGYPLTAEYADQYRNYLSSLH